MEEKLELYNYFTLSNFDGTGNTYRVIKTNENEKIGYCEKCDCTKKRVLDSNGNCYYHRMVNENYRTKLNVKWKQEKKLQIL